MAASPSLDLRAVVNSLQRLSIGQTEQLAFQLGVELNTLEDINIQYNGSSRKMHYIQAWLNDDPEPSWEKIVTGLRQNGLNVVAAEVESQYCPQSQVPGHNSAQPAVSSPDRIVERRVVLPSVTLGKLIFNVSNLSINKEGGLQCALFSVCTVLYSASTLWYYCTIRSEVIRGA